MFKRYMGKRKDVKNNMIVMQAVSTYQLLSLISYKQLKLQKEKAVLVIPYWLNNKFNDKSFFFDNNIKVYVFDCSPDYKNIDECEKYICRYFDSFFKNIGVDLNTCTQIHIGGAQYGMGAYLCKKSICFDLWEDASGIAHNPKILYDIEKNISVERNEYNYNLGLYDGSNEYINKVFVDVKYENDNSKFVEFDVIKALNSINHFDRNGIISLFSKVCEIIIPENSTLLLTEHFANCKRTSFDEQILLYQLILDYMLYNDNVIIKPHPDDLMFYKKIFPTCKVINDKFPSELIPFIFSNKPKRLATVSSSAIRPLRDIFENSIYLGVGFEKHYKFIHKYWFVKRMATFLGYNLSFFGEWKEMKNSLQSYGCNNSQKKEGNIILIDDFVCDEEQKEYILSIVNNSYSNIYVFLNSLDKCFFAEVHSIWDGMVIKSIEKRVIDKKNTFSDLDEELVFIYTNSSEDKERIKQMSYNKKLKNTNVEIVSKPILSDLEMENMILRGKLEATEKRLLYYINKNKEKEDKNNL